MTHERRILRISSGSVNDTETKRVIDQISNQLVLLQEENSRLKDRLDALKFPLEDFFGEVQLGNVPGVAYKNLEGTNPDFTVGGALETVWVVGGPYVYPTAAAIIAIASLDANDTLTGSGAQVVSVTGLDANGDALDETVNMDGLGTVNTLGSYLRVNTLDVVQAGAGGENAGQIDAVHGVDILRRIEVGISRDISAVLSVPNGKTAVILDQNWSVNDNGLIEGATAVRDLTTGIRRISSIVRFGSTGGGYISTPTGYRAALSPQTDIEARARVAAKTGSPTSVAVGVTMGVHVYDV